MISFIVPAHNEEFWIVKCVSSIHDAMRALQTDYEIIVVDDSSTDRTFEISNKQRAQVIQVDHRHISKARNSGAKAAHGNILFFIDADTSVSVASIQEALKAIKEGAVGGGCVPKYDGKLPLWFSLVYPIFLAIVRVLKQPGGSCLFCNRQTFEAIGGFSEEHYAAEDALFAIALKRQGSFVVVGEPVITSGRNFRAHSLWSFLQLVFRLILRGPNTFKGRHGLDIWYRPIRNREDHLLP